MKECIFTLDPTGPSAFLSLETKILRSSIPTSVLKLRQSLMKMLVLIPSCHVLTIPLLHLVTLLNSPLNLESSLLTSPILLPL